MSSQTDDRILATARLDVLRTVLSLPSETLPHLFSFGALLGISFVYFVFRSARAIFDWYSIYSAAIYTLTVVFVAIFIASLTFVTHRMPPSERGEINARWNSLRKRFEKLRLSLLADVIFPPRQFAAHPVAGVRPLADLHAGFAAIASQALPSREVALYWAPADLALRAYATGTNAEPAIVLSAAMARAYKQSPEKFEAIAHHELAHVANGDLGVFAWTDALFRGWNVSLIVAWIIWSGLFAMHFFTNAFIDAATALLGLALVVLQTMVFASAIGIPLLITRKHYSYIVSTRELYADLKAVEMHGGEPHLIDVLTPSPEPRLRRWLSGWATIRHSHFSAADRRKFIYAPERLLAPRVAYVLLLVAVIGFTAMLRNLLGPDESESAFPALWAVFVFSALTTSFRWTLFRAHAPRITPAWPVGVYAAIVAALLLAPWIQTNLASAFATVAINGTMPELLARDFIVDSIDAWSVVILVTCSVMVPATLIVVIRRSALPPSDAHDVLLLAAAAGTVAAWVVVQFREVSVTARMISYFGPGWTGLLALVVALLAALVGLYRSARN